LDGSVEDAKTWLLIGDDLMFFGTVVEDITVSLAVEGDGFLFESGNV
jgi:hypothetical protein